MKKNCLVVSMVFAVAASAVAPAQAEIVRKHRAWLLVKSHEAPTPAAELPLAYLNDVQSPAREPAPILRIHMVKSKSPESDKGVKVVDQALRYQGTRYRFGGNSKHGIDCSGLVNRVWQDLQMKKIPRASSSLYKSGTPVKLAQLQPGDLVFFKNTYRRGISHVGVYAGNNKFVHASSHKGVTVTPLSDPYYQLRYAGARRLF
jgi:cell wall-associated NlpC family hydrolase